MKIVGDFFDLYEITTESGQLFFGDQEMDIIRAVQDTLYFNLPEDAIAGTKIKIVSPIAGERLVPGRYYEREICYVIMTHIQVGEEIIM